MIRISSSWTLMFRLFIPAFWISFFLPLSVAALISHDVRSLFRGAPFSVGVIIFLITGLLFFYFTTWKLHRVDLDKENIYISDYFRTIRVPYPLVTQIRETDLFFFKLYKITLATKGRLGKHLRFLESGRSMRDWISENPELFGHITEDPA